MGSTNGDAGLARQWRLLKALASRRRGNAVGELAEELGVAVKTIRRDLDLLQQVGFPVQAVVGNRGVKRYSLARLDLEMSFTWQEALALHLGNTFLDPLAGTPLGQSAREAFRKIEACLGEVARDYLQKMAAHWHLTAVGASRYGTQGELLDVLHQALEESRFVDVAYRSLRATEPVTHRLGPLGLVRHRGALYLVADSQSHGEVRHFKLDRMTAVELANESFARPPAFDLAEHFSGSFGVMQGDGEIRVVVRFDAAVARYVEEGRWHGTQQLTRRDDGGMEAEFVLSSTEEVKSWVLSFGRHAEVLSPRELREEMREEWAAMGERYAEAGAKR